MPSYASINNIIAKLELKLKRQQQASDDTQMELEHWRIVRADLDKKEAKK